MHNKTTLILSSLVIFTLVLAKVPASFVYAENTSTNSGNLGVQELIQNTQREASSSATRDTGKLATIIKRADELITNRITELNKLLTRVSSDNRLTSDEKSSLTASVQSAISGLTTLKTKIDADTDATTAMNDAKQIFTNFKVYEILTPKMQLLITLNNIQTMVTNLQQLFPKLQDLINTFAASGHDVNTLNGLLSDINTQASAMTAVIAADITKVNAVDINTTNPQDVFQGVRTDIENTVKTGFGKIRGDILLMRPIFKTFINPTGIEPISRTPVSTSSATPLATP